MRLKLYHPWWTHLPALTLLGVIISVIVCATLLPEQGARQFGTHGQSLTMLLGVVLAPAILILIISVALDNDWARFERRKTFNWLSLFDEIVLSALAGLALNIFASIKAQGEVFANYPWAIFCSMLIGSVAVAVVLELMRHPGARFFGETDIAFAQKIREQIAAGHQWVYWESAPTRGTVFIPILSLMALFKAIMDWISSPSEPFIGFPYLIIAIFLFKYWGGLRTRITSESINQRMGIFGVSQVHISLTDIVTAEVNELSSLDFSLDFCPPKDTLINIYGYKRAVKLHTQSGRQFLIASTDPERLLMVIQTVMADNQS